MLSVQNYSLKMVRVQFLIISRSIYRDNSYRRLRSKSANRQIPLKIALSDHEFLVVQHYIQHRYKQYMTDHQDDLLFSVNHTCID